MIRTSPRFREPLCPGPLSRRATHLRATRLRATRLRATRLGATRLWAAHLCAAVTVLLALLACGVPRQAFRGEVVADPQPAPLLVGTNWDGQSFDLASQQGKVTLVFFGYTFCPDVCPFTLAKMKQVYARLGDRAAEVSVVFASVDPHRDSVTKLADYVPNFDPRFYGLYLDFQQLDRVKEAWGLTVQYGQPKDGPGTDSFYYVDHTGTFFILDRQGRLRLKFGPKAAVDDLVADLETLLSD